MKFSLKITASEIYRKAASISRYLEVSRSAMVAKSVVRNIALFGSFLAILTNIYVFTYPSVHSERCSWKCQQKNDTLNLAQLSDWEKAWYFTKRYLTDAKGQFWATRESEQDDDNQDPSDIHLMAFGDPQIKGVFSNTPYVSRLDIFGNDFFLGHIASMMRKRLEPSHIVVMGDLFSSQWIGDSEFYNRTSRYMKRIFNRDTSSLERIKSEYHDEEGQYKVDWLAWGKKLDETRAQEKPWDLGFHHENVYSWDPEKEDFLFINLTGNHDVGYAGDVTYQHMARFHQLFGKDNYWIEYDTDTDHPWRVVVLNSLLLEGPALQNEFIDVTWEFLYQLFERRFEGSTVLLTHVPFYKEEGLCADGPEFRYYPDPFEAESYKSNLLRSQNHLSEDVSNRVLNLVFDNDKPGIILTGHDHIGCETIYNKNSTSGTWKASKKKESKDVSIQEITVKAMMGEFHGNTGLVTGHFNKKTGTWDWNFSLCPFTVQHVWWVSKVSALFAGFLWSFYILL